MLGRVAWKLGEGARRFPDAAPSHPSDLLASTIPIAATASIAAPIRIVRPIRLVPLSPPCWARGAYGYCPDPKIHR